VNGLFGLLVSLDSSSMLSMRLVAQHLEAARLHHATGFRVEAPQHLSHSRASGWDGRRGVVTGRQPAKRFCRKDLTRSFSSLSAAISSNTSPRLLM